MCGIFLYIGEYPVSNLSAFSDKIKYRGPEQFKKLSLYIGKYFLEYHFYRLAIMEPSEESCQPFETENCIVMCNGEFYNYKKLIEEYQLDISGNLDNDCIMLSYLYEKIGFYPLLQKVNAEFALIITDIPNKKIFVARDQFGVRPLFIGCSFVESKLQTIGFASEAKALIGLFPNIDMVKPDMYYTIDLNNLKLETTQWYNYPSLLKQPRITNKEIIKVRVRDTLIKAVERRLMSDRPIGFLLSGGLDSSLIVSIATLLLGVKKIMTFSIGLPGGRDAMFAQKVVNFLKLENHHNVTFNVEEGINAIPEVIRRTETYDITTIRASTPQYLLAKYIRENTDIKVLLSGEGSDEIHGSYRYFKNAPSDSDFEKETIRLLEELYMFDCLRTDRTMSGNVLEVRVPFLDKEYVELVYQIPAEYKTSNDKLEKTFLREAFEGFLPSEVLWRPKEAFSDAVSSDDVSWYKSIEQKIINDNLHVVYMPSNEPQIPEAGYYKKIYEDIYSGYRWVKHYWLPKFQNKRIDDPSATILR